MSDYSRGLSSEELWDKCQRNEAITSQDLGLSSSQSSSDGTTYFTEGVNMLQFENKNSNKH